MSILIVEEENKSAELIYEIFNKEKRDLFFVCDEVQALIAFRKYKTSILIIDLKILCVNDFNLIQIMKIENPQIKIIALNSTSYNYDVEKYQEKYFDILIEKNDIYKCLYDAYLELINNNEVVKMKSKIFEFSSADLNESLFNLKLFQKAFETKIKSIK